MGRSNIIANMCSTITIANEFSLKDTDINHKRVTDVSTSGDNEIVSTAPSTT